MPFPERLSIPEVVIVNSCETGQGYNVLIGLPPASEVDASGIIAHEVPNQPYVVPVDTFVLRELALDGTKPALLIEEGVNVLFMHGCFRNKRWVPGDPTLQAMGVTIPGIVEDFEAVRPDMLIDVLYIYSTELSPPSNAPKLYNQLRPKVFTRAGTATGMGIRTIQGRVHTDMFVNSRDEITYLPWLTRRRGRPSRIRFQDPDEPRSLY